MRAFLPWGPAEAAPRPKDSLFHYRPEAGYLSPMALAGFCTVCQRTVYVDADSTPICPVCSSPLLEAAAPDDDSDDQESVASAEK